MNRPSCHNLLCTILDFADARKPELCCVAVTVRSDNPSLLANHRRSTKKGEDMTLRSQRLAEIREHIKAESSHDMKALLAGMTSDCFNDVAAVPKPFRGTKRVAERYQQHWAGFPDFKFASSGYLLWERAPLLPKTSGAEPISASFSAIHQLASTSRFAP